MAFRRLSTTFILRYLVGARMGIFTALAIGTYNFPEGLTTFLGVLSDPTIGVAITIAIAIHSIPEDFSVSGPVYLIEMFETER